MPANAELAPATAAARDTTVVFMMEKYVLNVIETARGNNQAAGKSWIFGLSSNEDGSIKVR